MTLIADNLSVTAPADHVVGPVQGRWTYTDYAAIPDDGNRYEMVEGVLYMAPAPTLVHQAANRWFLYYLTAHVQVPGLGQVFGAPTDVELPTGDVLQPDVLVVLNKNTAAFTKTRIIGTPDLIVEIASPSTSGYDRRQKQDAYARAGVWEYWVADPNAKTVELLVLENSAYRSKGAFLNKAILPSPQVALPVRVEQFFE